MEAETYYLLGKTAFNAGKSTLAYIDMYVISSALMFGILATVTIIVPFFSGLRKGYDLIVKREQNKSYLYFATLPIIYSFIGLLVFIFISSMTDFFATDSATSIYNFFTINIDNYSQVLENQGLKFLKIQLGFMDVFSSLVLALLAFMPFILLIYSYLITFEIRANTSSKKGNSSITIWIINIFIVFTLAGIFLVYFNSISNQVFLKKPIEHARYGKIINTRDISRKMMIYYIQEGLKAMRK
ncbi:MAG: hypothetical protein KAQ94_02755 [Arcobacteraceae bacterium]|nr:hypothetical protein [Arcobacteraceae bacterium]